MPRGNVRSPRARLKPKQRNDGKRPANAGRASIRIVASRQAVALSLTKTSTSRAAAMKVDKLISELPECTYKQQLQGLLAEAVRAAVATTVTPSSKPKPYDLGLPSTSSKGDYL